MPEQGKLFGVPGKKKRPIENPAFDITANRHGGNPESAAANERIALSKESSRRQIYEYALSRGLEGITADEVAAHFGCTHNHVAPRISELKALGLLSKTERRRATRSGCKARVLVAVEKP